ncbi:MAG: winged helix-turn-helix domain-containing protein [Actinomycetota bacterium]|nr:winged helix-turn-helix domain-containing protein [Actinomycetota bacterium]
MHGQNLLVKIEINPDLREHTYLQLARQLRAGIRSGEIGPRLPSLMELTEETGLAPNTVRRAIKVLADEGLVITEPGRGTFVAGTEAGDD